MIPKYLYLKLCQAVLEAAQAMGDAIILAQPDSVELSPELAAAMKEFLSYHPEEEVGEFYLAEIDRLMVPEDEDEGSGCC